MEAYSQILALMNDVKMNDGENDYEMKTVQLISPTIYAVSVTRIPTAKVHDFTFNDAVDDVDDVDDCGNESKFQRRRRINI